MIQLGKQQVLTVLRTTSIGVYLGEEYDPLAVFARKSTGNNSSMTETPDLLLPKNEIKEPLNVGDKVKVFVYKDSEDRPIATKLFPPLQIGGIAPLKVKEVNKIGAFLDWGLVKDLMLPYHEQTAEVKCGDTVLVTLYIDKSKRLCASMKLYHQLRTDSDHKKGDWVEGMVYELSDNFGSFVAVDNCYSGLIPKKELVRTLNVGDKVKVRVANVLEDGKLELSLREPAHLQLDVDSKTILELLEKNNGVLPYHDKSDADEIKEFFGITKNSFKRSIGHMYKSGIIEITDSCIKKRTTQDRKTPITKKPIASSSSKPAVAKKSSASSIKPATTKKASASSIKPATTKKASTSSRKSESK